MEMKGHAHVVKDGHGRKQADVLERPRDAVGGDLVRLFADDGFAREFDFSAGRSIDAGDEIEDGGFSRAVGADQTTRSISASGR